LSIDDLQDLFCGFEAAKRLAHKPLRGPAKLTDCAHEQDICGTPVREKPLRHSQPHRPPFDNISCLMIIACLKDTFSSSITRKTPFFSIIRMPSGKTPILSISEAMSRWHSVIRALALCRLFCRNSLLFSGLSLLGNFIDDLS